MDKYSRIYVTPVNSIFFSTTRAERELKKFFLVYDWLFARDGVIALRDPLSWKILRDLVGIFFFFRFRIKIKHLTFRIKEIIRLLELYVANEERKKCLADKRFTANLKLMTAVGFL